MECVVRSVLFYLAGASAVLGRGSKSSILREMKARKRGVAEKNGVHLSDKSQKK